MSDLLKKILVCLQEGAVAELRDALASGASTTPRALRLPSHAVALIATKLGVHEDAILNAAGISFERAKPRPELLTGLDTVRLIRVAYMVTEAVRVFSNMPKARRWMASQNNVLGDAPLNLLATEAGYREVQNELIRIDEGDFC